jgi:gliding motility-associated lipoprotein GldH
MKLTGFIIIALVFFSSCTTNGVYERMSFFPKHEWNSNQKQSFNFEVTDTLSTYRLYLVLRHTDAYRWKNIWVNIQLKAPDTTYTIKREFILADNEKWHGTTVDDIIDQRIPFQKNNMPVPLKKGMYTFTLQHVMREDPLQHVMNAGIRVEKVE